MGLSGLAIWCLPPPAHTRAITASALRSEKAARLTSCARRDKPLAEGVATAPALVIRPRKERIELPVAETVAALLDGSLPARPSHRAFE